MNVKTLIVAILDKMPEIGKWQSEFLIENFDLQCRMRDWHNFFEYGSIQFKSLAHK